MCSEEDRSNMILEKNRLESFKMWPYTDNKECNPRIMAEAGFFWTGNATNPDSAQCFVCNKHLDGWESTDDPWTEHKKHSPKCPFVVISKPEELLTLKEFIGIWKSMQMNLSEQKYKEIAQLWLNQLEVTVGSIESNLS